MSRGKITVLLTFRVVGLLQLFFVFVGDVFYCLFTNQFVLFMLSKGRSDGKYDKVILEIYMKCKIIIIYSLYLPVLGKYPFYC